MTLLASRHARLVPGIHVLPFGRSKDVDGWDKPAMRVDPKSH
jgi:hypothetical protein